MIRRSDLQNNAIAAEDISRRGRPPDPNKMEPINVRIPPQLHDELCRQASRESRSLAEVIREALLKYVKHHN